MQMENSLQATARLKMTNNVQLHGTVLEVSSPFESRGVKYRKMMLSVKRLSGVIDTLPVVFKDNAAWMVQVGKEVEIEGTLRTRNVIEESGKNRLEITVYGFINPPEEFEYESMKSEEAKDQSADQKEQDLNAVEIEGYVCKPVVTRETPSKKKVTDILIAVNTQFGRSHYIPLVSFYSDARRAAKLTVGDRVLVTGRFQSRDYNKKISEDKIEKRTAYEVVVSSLKLVKDEENNNGDSN